MKGAKADVSTPWWQLRRGSSTELLVAVWRFSSYVVVWLGVSVDEGGHDLVVDLGVGCVG